jgi:hypothetical protein
MNVCTSAFTVSGDFFISVFYWTRTSFAPYLIYLSVALIGILVEQANRIAVSHEINRSPKLYPIQQR